MRNFIVKLEGFICGGEKGHASLGFPCGQHLLLSCLLQLNHNLYEVMSKLEKQHSDKVFVVKGLSR